MSNKGKRSRFSRSASAVQSAAAASIGLNKQSVPFRQSAIAVAVSVALYPAVASSNEWNRNIEVSAARGSDRSIGSLAILQPIRQTSDSLTYLDLRAVFSDRETEEFNFGLGHRILRDGRILGGYLSYDTREARSNENYDQVTFGVESLGELWDVRGNYYLPVGDDDNVVGAANSGGTFIGSGLFTNGIVEEAMEGFDVEVGRRIDLPSGLNNQWFRPEDWEVRAYLAGYHFDGDVADDADGGRFRLEVRPRKNLAFELSYQDDDTFDDQVFFKATYSFGYKNEAGRRTLRERMIQFVERDIDIKETGELSDADKTSSSDLVQVNLGANPLNVIHVDNTSPVEGADGTAENPFPDFASCDICDTENSLIVAHPGDSDLAAPGTGYSEDVTLVSGQSAIGGGAGTVKVGSREIELDGFGDTPTVMNGAGDGIAIVTLADNSEVAGFHFLSGNNPIAVFGENVSGVNVHDNAISQPEGADPFLAGIGLYANMPGSFTGNRIANNTISGSAVGIAIASELTEPGELMLEATVSGNTIDGIDDGFDGFGYAGGILVANIAEDGSSTQEITLTGNIVQDVTGDGIAAFNIAEADGTMPLATQTLTLLDNHVSGSTDDGVDINNEAIGIGAVANQTATINEVAEDNEEDGLDIENYAFYGGAATQSVTVSNSSFSDNEDEGIEIDNEAEGAGSVADQTIVITGSTIEDNDGTGIDISNNAYYGGTATQTFDIADNTIIDNEGEGIGIYNRAYGAPETATQSGTLTGNMVSDNGSGVSIRNRAGDDGRAIQSEIVLEGNTITDNEGEGLYIGNRAFGENSEATQVVLLNETITDNGGAGIYIRNRTFDDDNATATQTVDIGNSEISGNDWTGIGINNSSDDGTDNTATQTVTVSGAEIVDNEGDGISIYNGGDGVSTQTVTVTDVTISESGQNGIYLRNRAFNADSVLTQTVNLTGVEISDSGRDGLGINNYARYGAATQNVDITDLTVSDSDDNGIYIRNRNFRIGSETTQTVNLAGATVTDSGRDGVAIQNYAGDGLATQMVNLSDLSIVDSDDNGIYARNGTFDADGEANQTLNLTDVTVDDSGQYGIYLRNRVFEGNGTQSVNLTNTAVSNSDESGMRIYNRGENGGAATQAVDLSLGGNSVTTSDEFGVDIRNQYSGGGTATQTVDLTGADLTGNDEGDVYVDSGSDPTQTITLPDGTPFVP